MTNEGTELSKRASRIEGEKLIEDSSYSPSVAIFRNSITVKGYATGYATGTKFSYNIW